MVQLCLRRHAILHDVPQKGPNIIFEETFQYVQICCAPFHLVSSMAEAALDTSLGGINCGMVFHKAKLHAENAPFAIARSSNPF